MEQSSKKAKETSVLPLVLQAEMLYNLLKKLGFTWSQFDNFYRNNPIYKHTDTIHADFDIVK